MKPYYQDDAVTIYHGDAADFIGLLPDVDLIYTDPPYPAEFIGCYTTLGRLAATHLVDGGSLVTLFGHYQLPQVLGRLTDEGLRYHWLCILPSTQGSARMFGYGLIATYKPLLWMTKGKARQRKQLMPDTLTVASQMRHVKALHPWAQGSAAGPTIYLAEPGQTILDPFMGSGTNLVAAKWAGRKAIGIELDERHCETAARRCSQETLGLGAA
jgi:hypothetical protein